MSDYHFWANRYKTQASWTWPIRQYILKQIKLPKHCNVLEVGCGSQAVLQEFTNSGHKTIGIDIDYSILKYSKSNQLHSTIINANGYDLPFKDNYFDLSFCHYLLLWSDQPITMLEELTRVTKKSGWVCCFAEPDYLARIDHPQELERLAEIQNKSLQKQGVNLTTGRNMLEWFAKIKLANINWGIIGSQNSPSTSKGQDLEWNTIIKDVQEYISREELDALRIIEFESQNKGTRIMFVPTFYAYAQKL
jgi:ubiquinone/menaquinone biosynthesis C-methylase UbiE